MDLFGSDLRRRESVSKSCLHHKQRSKYAHQVDLGVQGIALWWMAHRVVEAGQGFDLVHQFRRHLLLLRWLLIGALQLSGIYETF